MAESALNVVVKFIGDASSIQSEAAKVEGTGGKLKSWAKGVAAAVGTAFAINEIKDFVSAADEAEAASARLGQTMKNAGDSTGEWTKKAEDLATTLMNKTGIDDEVIKGGEAILATFHSVSDATAQQAGIFARATTAATDLSKAGFGDVDSAAKALGKALQDPVQGITALRRAGVNFTQAQKDQIAALVATGDTLGAQKIILGEVEGQVGGVAEKTATSADKMKASWHETQEALGKALLPALTALAPPLQAIAGFVQDNATWLVPLAAAIGAVVAVVKAWSIAQAILNVLMDANPIGLLVIAIAALIAAVVLIVTNFDTVKEVAGEVWGFVLGVIQAVWEWIKDNWPLLLAILTGPFGIAVALIIDNWGTIKGFFSDLISAIGGIVGRVIAFITAPFRSAIDTVKDIIGEVTGAWDSVIGAVKGVWNSFARGWNGITLHIPEVDIPIIGKIGGGSVSLPNLPILGQGGIATRATLALIGEAGPEAVVPLNGRAFGSVVNITVNVTPTGLGADAPEIQRQVVNALRGYVDRNGPLSGVAR